MAITQRTQIIMNPTIPKSEEGIADSIDRWKEQIRVFDTLGSEYSLPSAFKETALRQLMIGKARDYYDSLDASKMEIDELLAKCYEYANRKRLDHRSKTDPMDVGEVGDTNDESNYPGEAGDSADWSNWSGDWSSEIDAIGKGKGKGEGKGKGNCKGNYHPEGKGKGNYQCPAQTTNNSEIQCYNCKGTGHIARFCPSK